MVLFTLCVFRYPSIKVFGEAKSGDDDFSSLDDVDELDFELSENDELQSVADCRKMPVCVSLAKIRDCFVVDPSVEEEMVRFVMLDCPTPDVCFVIQRDLCECRKSN